MRLNPSKTQSSFVYAAWLTQKTPPRRRIGRSLSCLISSEVLARAVRSQAQVVRPLPGKQFIRTLL
jgi:hypothetical protein